jgi:hypothetical protein
VEALLRPLFGLAADPVLDKLLHLTDSVHDAVATLTEPR